MYKMKRIVPDLPLINCPDVCASSPERGKAFCKEHCEVAVRQGIPVDLKEFLTYCTTNGKYVICTIVHLRDDIKVGNHYLQRFTS